MSTKDALDTSSERDKARAREWLFVAFASLFVAGLLACLLVVARTPALSWLARDPGFFKRCLVVHVDLALVVWFYAFVAALFATIPSRVRANILGAHGAYAAGLGAVVLVLSAFAKGAVPVLANYVPVVDHPLYVAGLVAIGIGLAVTFLDAKILPGTEVPGSVIVMPPAAIVMIRAAALAVLVALVTFAASAIEVTPGLAPEARWEILMWGGGHVLQVASVAAMLAVWTLLVARATGAPPVSREASTVLSALLVMPILGAPVLALEGDHGAFTRLMQFGIAPAMVVYLILCVRALVVRRAHVTRGDPALLGFAASAILCVLGVALGASIRGSNTVVPAHYHASIGAVTVAFMAITPTLLVAVGMRPLEGRMARVARVQPALLGFGQAVFALGFALAGQHGMRRKTYGGEQEVRTLAEWAGLTVMGLGGAVAVAGGVLFLVIVGAMWRRRVAVLEQRGGTWRGLPARTRSNA
jgi:cytochrome c oxidase subunit I